MRRAAAWLLLLLALPALAGCSKQPVAMQVNAEVIGRDVQLRVNLENFDLQKDGHLHLFLDDLPDPAMIQRATYTFKNLRPGQHVIRVQLTDPNHEPLPDPQTDQKVTVTIS